MAIFDTLAVARKVAIFENFVAEKHENVLATLGGLNVCQMDVFIGKSLQENFTLNSE